MGGERKGDEMSDGDQYIVTPEERAITEFRNALADAFKRGEQAGRAEVLRYLTLIVTATDETSRTYAIKQAERELKKWGA